MEENLHTEKIEHKNDVERLNAKIDRLTEENRLLKDDNARLRSIINNDSSNTSLPPSIDQKGGKPANAYNSRQHTERKAGGRKEHKSTTFTKEEVEEKIRSGKCKREIREIGNPSNGTYVTKYVVDLDAAPLVTVLYSEGVMSNDRIAAFLNAKDAQWGVPFWIQEAKTRVTAPRFTSSLARRMAFLPEQPPQLIKPITSIFSPIPENAPVFSRTALKSAVPGQ